MVKFDLRDTRIVEHFEMVQNIRKSGWFTDEEIQEMYDRQLEKDMKDGDG